MKSQWEWKWQWQTLAAGGRGDEERVSSLYGVDLSWRLKLVCRQFAIRRDRVRAATSGADSAPTLACECVSVCVSLFLSRLCCLVAAAFEAWLSDAVRATP